MLKNKMVLITGASKGVGRSIAILMSKKQAKIVLLARSEEKLKELSDIVRENGSQAIVVPLDLRDKERLIIVIDKLISEHGVPDILINNAGIGYRDYWMNLSFEEELSMLEVNCIAPILLMKLIVPQMIKRQSGHVINVNSVAGMYSAPYQSGYCASKSALLAYSYSLAFELKNTGVYLSNIIPGAIDTDFINNKNYEGFKKEALKNPPELIAKKVLLAIDTKREIIFIGSMIKQIAVKIAGLRPDYFREIIEKKNIPPTNKNED